MKFTINKNGGPVLQHFTAKTFDDFKAVISDVWKTGSEEGLKSFFYDRHQVKTPVDTNILICRVRA